MAAPSTAASAAATSSPASARRGRQAEHIADRADCGRRLAELARPGDRILIMGARDDTLSLFAEDVLEAL